MKAAEGALMDLGRRETTFGVIDHHIIGYVLRKAAQYLPSSLLNYGMWKEGTTTNAILRKRNHSFV
jgi:hypothetical protein